MNMSHIQGETTNFGSAGTEGNKAQDSTKERGLATTTLAGDTYKLASAYVEVEAAK